MANIKQEIRAFLRAWDLAARKFDAVLGVILFEFSADASRKQISHFYSENTSDNEQFKVGNTSFLIFKVCHGFPAGVPTKQLQLDRKFVLGPTFSLAEFPHLRPHYIQYFSAFFDSGTLATATHKHVSFTRHLRSFFDFACCHAGCVR
jgi:hypothetical protein